MEMGTQTFTDSPQEKRYLMGVRRLCENGIESIPSKYIWPLPDRPTVKESEMIAEGLNLKLPVIDLEQLQSSNRSQVLKLLANACEEFGFFQVVNHGIPSDVINRIINVSQRFFELPFEERARLMSGDMFAPVRYGTSVNQNRDGIFCWRDFLKLNCHPLAEASTFWPPTPADLRYKGIVLGTEEVASYAKATKFLFFILVKAVLESLGLVDDGNDDILEELEDGSQLMVINCYPSCPEPDLTLGMPPHSDYGFLTLLLQDGVKGLQVHYRGEWLTVEPLANSFVVNVGDHLEIFSNGKYKSVLHRVFVNSSKSRISVVSLHSLPYEKAVRPCPRLVNEEEGNPRRYKDTDFATFLQYVSSRGSKGKTFLESRKL
ncbi:hypothetical protein ACLOJK_025215 [Asimina triloba]